MTDRNFGHPAAFRRAVVAMFVLSGAAGLVYEIVWARQLVLVFGNTTQAISAILTGFFAGLAIGSVVGGRIADRVDRPLRLYAVLELVLVAVVLVTPLLFQVVREAYAAGFSQLGDSPPALGIVRLGLAVLALAPATILMGATLPTLSRYLARRRDELGSAFGRLYAANTLGAIVGTAAAGFVLIEALGLTGALVVGTGGSAIAGLIAIALDRRAGPSPASGDVPSALPADGRPPGARRMALGVAFVSGLTSLGYQVLWTRLLSSGTSNHTYVFTSILSLFLVGIVIGAAAYAIRPAGPARTVPLLGLTQVLVAVIAVVGVGVTSEAVGEVELLEKLVVVVLPATVVLGVSLPLASGIAATSDRRVGSDAGVLLGVNTAGVICGTFAVPFFLVPIIGSPSSVLVLAVVNAVTGILLLRARRAVFRPARFAMVAASIVVAAAVIAMAIRPAWIRHPAEQYVLRYGELWQSTEDEIASVQAGRLPDGERLWVGGTAMTLLTVDARLMTYLPLMARPDSETALVIAFGMGSSLRSATIAGLEVDGVELVPSVPTLMGHYFADAEEVLERPGVRIVVADGRNFVELTDRTYDLVIADPPPPVQSSGTTVLYAREFYAASASRLAPGGVMMEWMAYGQSVDEFRSHVGTFASVFRHVLVAFGTGPYGVFMLGSDEPIDLRPEQIQAVLQRPGVLEDLAEPFDSPADSIAEWERLLLDLVWVEDDDARAFAAAAPLITDDRPLPEYFLLRRTFGPDSPPMTPRNLLAAQAASR